MGTEHDRLRLTKRLRELDRQLQVLNTERSIISTELDGLVEDFSDVLRAEFLERFELFEARFSEVLAKISRFESFVSLSTGVPSVEVVEVCDEVDSQAVQPS